MPLPTLTDQQIKHLFRNMPQRYLVVGVDDPTFTLVEENIEHSKIAFQNIKDVIGRPFFEVFPDTSDKFKETGVSDLMESLRTVIRTKQPDDMDALRYDIKNEAGDYEEHWWRATHYPIFDETGAVCMILQATNDITEEMLSANKAEIAQRSLDDILAIGSIGTWFWNVTDNTLTADKNLAAIFGVSAAEAAAGLPLEVFTSSIYEADRERVGIAIAEAVKKLGFFEEEYRTVMPDGSINWVIARGAASSDGKTTIFPGAIVDITEQKEANLQMDFLLNAGRILAGGLQIEANLQSVAEASVDFFADWCSVNIMASNGTLEMVALAGLTPEKMKQAGEWRKGQNETAASTSGMYKVMNTGKTIFEPHVNQSKLKKAGIGAAERDFYELLGIESIIMTPIKLQDKIVGTINLATEKGHRQFHESDVRFAELLAGRVSLAMTNADLYRTLEHRVTERTELLNATNLNLERSNQELQDFAYVASHDLQEPLRKIQAFGDLLESEFGQDLGDGKDYLDRMRGAAGRMSVLIEDLLSFSRVTTHGKEPVDIDLNKIAAGVVEDLETRISSTGGRVKLGELPTIEADPTQMRQLLQNLIGNALKFHKPDELPVVTVSTAKADKGFVTIEVTDNGVGFDEKYLDKIFAVFQRLHGRSTYEGTGIGLAVCRKIVERHGGTITATSQPNIGSTFIITLPKKARKGDTNGA